MVTTRRQHPVAVSRLSELEQNKLTPLPTLPGKLSRVRLFGLPSKLTVARSTLHGRDELLPRSHLSI